VVYENAKAGTAYVVESNLKVMLEVDYLSLEKNTVGAGLAPVQHKRATASVARTDVNTLGSQIVREIVIPELTKEVNEGKNFAQLRQVYNSLILAAWYKKKIKQSILSQVYADKNKVAGVNVDNPNDKDMIYQQYLKAFKKGVYNYIKEDVDPVSSERIPRKYFSGGVNLDCAMSSTSLNANGVIKITTDAAMISRRQILGAGFGSLLLTVNVLPSSLLAQEQSKVTGQVEQRELKTQIIDRLKEQGVKVEFFDNNEERWMGFLKENGILSNSTIGLTVSTMDIEGINRTNIGFYGSIESLSEEVLLHEMVHALQNKGQRNRNGLMMSLYELKQALLKDQNEEALKKFHRLIYLLQRYNSPAAIIQEYLEGHISAIQAQMRLGLMNQTRSSRQSFVITERDDVKDIKERLDADTAWRAFELARDPESNSSLDSQKRTSEDHFKGDNYKFIQVKELRFVSSAKVPALTKEELKSIQGLYLDSPGSVSDEFFAWINGKFYEPNKDKRIRARSKTVQEIDQLARELAELLPSLPQAKKAFSRHLEQYDILLPKQLKDQAMTSSLSVFNQSAQAILEGYIGFDKGSIEADISFIDITLEKSNIRVRSLAYFLGAIRRLFPELAEDFQKWRNDIYETDSKVYIDIPDDLMKKLRELYEKQKDALLRNGVAFDYLQRFFAKDPDTRLLAQEFISRNRNIAEMEDADSKEKVNAAVDWLGGLYGLEADKIQAIKNSALVVKSKAKSLPVFQQNFIETAFKVIGLLTQGKRISLLDESKIEAATFDAASKGILLRTRPQQINIQDLITDILSMSDMFGEIVNQMAEAVLRESEGSMFGAVKEQSAKHVVFIHEKDGEAGVLSEVGHLIFENLAGYDTAKDFGVHEMFDSLSRLAGGRSEVAPFYDQTGPAIVAYLKGKTVREIMGDQRERDPERKIDSFLFGEDAKPRDISNKVDALHVNTAAVRQILTQAVGAEKAKELIDKDTQIVSHSVGVYLAKRLISMTGTIKAPLYARYMIEHKGKGWMNDFEAAERMIEETVDDPKAWDFVQSNYKGGSIASDNAMTAADTSLGADAVFQALDGSRIDFAEDDPKREEWYLAPDHQKIYHVSSALYAIRALFEQIPSLKGKNFFDLGSSDGRVVVAAALMGAQAVGMEYNQDTFNEGVEKTKKVLARLERDHLGFPQFVLQEESQSRAKWVRVDGKEGSIELRQGNYISSDADLSKQDVLFRYWLYAGSAITDEGDRQGVEFHRKLKKELKEGAYFIEYGVDPNAAQLEAPFQLIQQDYRSRIYMVGHKEQSVNIISKAEMQEQMRGILNQIQRNEVSQLAVDQLRVRIEQDYGTQSVTANYFVSVLNVLRTALLLGQKKIVKLRDLEGLRNAYDVMDRNALSVVDDGLAPDDVLKRDRHFKIIHEILVPFFRDLPEPSYKRETLFSRLPKEQLQSWQVEDDENDSPLKEELFSLGKRLNIQAHGTGRARYYGMGGLPSLLNIALEGKLRQTPEGAYVGELVGSNGQFMAGDHGPFYAVLIKSIGSSRPLFLREFQAFLVKTDVQKKAVLHDIQLAQEEGLITQAQANEIKAKFMTYAEFIKANQDKAMNANLIKGENLTYDFYQRTLTVRNIDGTTRVLRAMSFGRQNDIFDLGDSVIRVLHNEEQHFSEEDVAFYKMLGDIGASPQFISESGLTANGHSYLHVQKVQGVDVQTLIDTGHSLDTEQLDAIKQLIDLLIENEVYPYDLYYPANIMLGRINANEPLKAFLTDFDLVGEIKGDVRKLIKAYIEGTFSKPKWVAADPQGVILNYLRKKLQADSPQSFVNANEKVVQTPQQVRLSLPQEINLKNGFYLKAEAQDDSKIDFKYYLRGTEQMGPQGELTLLWVDAVKTWQLWNHQLKTPARGIYLGEEAVGKLLSYLGVISSNGIGAAQEESSVFDQKMWQRMGAVQEYVGTGNAQLPLAARAVLPASGYAYVLRVGDEAMVSGEEERADQLERARAVEGFDYDQVKDYFHVWQKDGSRFPYGYWSNAKTVANHVLVALDELLRVDPDLPAEGQTESAFRQARLRNDVKKMAQLYRHHVMGYKSTESDKTGSKLFFKEAAGIKKGMNNPQFLDKRDSPAALLRLVVRMTGELKGLVNQDDKDAIKPWEIEEDYDWTEAAATEAVVNALRWYIPGFQDAMNRGSIKQMANLYRTRVVNDGGQKNFFIKIAGLSGLISSPRAYLTKIQSPGELMIMLSKRGKVLEGLVDMKNKDALKPWEITDDYWTEEHAAEAYVEALKLYVPGFAKAMYEEVPNIKLMASLYRQYVIGYKNAEAKTNGQIGFIQHEAGMLSLLSNKRSFLDRRGSPASLLKLAIKHESKLNGLIDQGNEDALKEREISHLSSGDEAMLGVERKGGIDFNIDRMDLQVKNENGEIKFNLNPAQLEQLRQAPGFKPVILGIEPLESLPRFLGISEAGQAISGS